MGWNERWGGFPPYVSVAEKKAKAAKEIAALKKKGRLIAPVVLQGRAIATTFWGKAWCQNLERYSDYSNRLPRGRSYLRCGSVVDLQIAPGKVSALVQGSSLYTVEIDVASMEPMRWDAVVRSCAGKISSVIALLQGKLQGAVMEVISCQETGLFPSPKQIRIRCSCPDWATLCKHAAATLYGIGARLDREPELLFRLRGADPADLVSSAAAGALLDKGPVRKELALDGDLASVFGIDLEPAAALPERQGPRDSHDLRGERRQGIEARRPPRTTTREAVRGREAARRRKAARPVTIRGVELSAMGVPPATVQYWLKTGVLLRTETRGIYGMTPRAEERLQRRPGRAPLNGA
jgi:uncharacterized Zn finger protein